MHDETSPVSFKARSMIPLDRRVSTSGEFIPPGGQDCPTRTDGLSTEVSPGELLTRGYSVMSGYWEDPENTAAPSTEPVGCTLEISPPSMKRATATSLRIKGHDHSRRKEHLSPRNRGVSFLPSRLRRSRSSACPMRSTAREVYDRMEMQ